MTTAANLALDETEQEMQRSVRRFLSETHPTLHTRDFLEGDHTYDAEVWKRLALELGIASIAIPEARGGQGFDPMAVGVVAMELGRNLVPGPFLPTVALGVSLLLAADDPRADELLDAVTTRAVTLRVAINGVTDPTTITPSQVGDTWELSGTVDLVPTVGGEDATLLVARLTDGEVVLFDLLEDPRESLPLTSNDLTRPFHRLEMERTRARRLSATSDAVLRAIDSATILLAAESLGASQACLDMTVQYAKERVQFGRPIGSFQYVKHACADLLMKVEGVRSAVLDALRVAANGSNEEVARAASMAKRVSDDVLWDVTRQSIQLHGGIGFTWEHDAHLYLRRAMGNRQLLGTPSWHADRLERHLGLVGH